MSSDPIYLRFVSGPDIDALGLTPADIVAAATDVVAAHGRGETVFEPRTHLEPDNDGRGHFNVLRGHVSTLGDHGVSGIKVVGDFVSNYEVGLPSELALLTLYDPWTGVPLAILDATLITEARTGAMTAVGAHHLARPDAKVLGHIGARGTAHSNIVMLDAMFDLDEIRVTSRRPESREAFADRLRAELSTPVVVTDSAAETLDGADIAVEATRLREPASLITPDLLAPGSLLVPYGTISALDPDAARRRRQGRRRRLARGAGRQLRRAATAPALGSADPRDPARGARRGGHRCAPRSRERRGADPLLAPRAVDPGRGRRPPHPRARRGRRPRDDGALPMTVLVDQPADLDRQAVLAIASGAPVQLSEGLLVRLAARRTTALAALADGPDVYGVTTGMGALSDTRLTVEDQAGHSERLMLARAVGAPPWLSRIEARALVAVRLRTFLAGDAAVSAELCAWLATLLAHDVAPAVPRTGSGAAGEILPLAHAWGHLAGVGRVLDADGSAVPAGPVVDPLGPPRLGPKEGIALLAGVPTATALVALRAADVDRLVDQSTAVLAAGIVLVGVSRDPYLPAVARGDDELAESLARLGEYVAPLAAPAHLQAPVSFRVAGPVLAHLRREAGRLAQVADRALDAVGDSPAYLPTEEGDRFVGTAGFHGLDQAAGLDSARGAVVHAAAVGAARLHRMLDPGGDRAARSAQCRSRTAGRAVTGAQASRGRGARGGGLAGVVRLADGDLERPGGRADLRARGGRADAAGAGRRRAGAGLRAAGAAPGAALAPERMARGPR